MKIHTLTILVFLLNCLLLNVHAAEIVLTCQMENCTSVEEIYLYQFEGFGFTKMKTALKDKDGKFEFKIAPSRDKFYYVGTTPHQSKPVILGKENVKIKGVCDNFGNATIEGSEINFQYNRLKTEMGRLKAKAQNLLKQYQRHQNNAEKIKEITQEMAQVDEERIALLESYGNQFPILTEIAAINTYLSYENNQGDYYTEVDYFANEFFRFVNFNTELYYNNPWVYESVKEYTHTLSSINIDKSLHQSYLDDLLNQISASSPTYQLVLSGIVAGMEGLRHPNYTMYGQRLLNKYEKTHLEAITDMKKKIDLASAFLPGAIAPDFGQITPKGDSLHLSDLRGKVVLVDFWASWCGPCRRENPNVKKVYEKYKDKGFDILGVSLDRTKDAWTRAIEKDGLPWHHISDLKGWKNEAAQLYSVSSIPYTILLDQEGRIVASKLRSHQLEAELEKIFGAN